MPEEKNKNQTMAAAAAWCAKAERCEWEVSRKLAEWNIPLLWQYEILDFLEKENYINHERYCNAFVRDKIRFNKWGDRRIRIELIKRQIPVNLIEQCLQKHFPPEIKMTALVQLLQKKQQSIKNASPAELHNKLLCHAIAKGFSIIDAQIALKQIGSEPDFDDSDDIQTDY